MATASFLKFDISGSTQVQLLNPVATDKLGRLPALVYCPGEELTCTWLGDLVKFLTRICMQCAIWMSQTFWYAGSDGTGNSIAPQLPGLTAAGFDVR